MTDEEVEGFEPVEPPPELFGKIQKRIDELEAAKEKGSRANTFDLKMGLN